MKFYFEVANGRGCSELAACVDEESVIFCLYWSKNQMFL